MLYFKGLQQGLAELPQADPKIRAKLEEEAQRIGWPGMHQRLAKIDPKSAARIKPSDPQRISRALEVYEITGRNLTYFFERQQANAASKKYNFINLALKVERAELHQRIAKRFDQMLAQGLVTEVEGFFNRDDITADLPAMRSVGYAQVWQYLAGELDADNMRERAIIATRQLAKRQMTWLRAWPDVRWVDPSAADCLHEALATW